MGILSDWVLRNKHENARKKQQVERSEVQTMAKRPKRSMQPESVARSMKRNPQAQTESIAEHRDPLETPKPNEVPQPSSSSENFSASPESKMESAPAPHILPPLEKERISADKNRIADRAYRLWEKEGRPAGRSDEFWLRAERELQSDKQPH